MSTLQESLLQAMILGSPSWTGEAPPPDWPKIEGEAPRRLLLHLAVAQTLQAAGMKPRAFAPLEEARSAQAEEKAQVSPAAVEVLQEILRLEEAGLIGEWIGLAAARNLLAHPRHVPELLAWGEKRSAWHQQILHVSGNLGGWLLEQAPTLRQTYLVREEPPTIETATASAERWLAQPTEENLAALRKAWPVEAREFRQAVFRGLARNPGLLTVLSDLVEGSLKKDRSLESKWQAFGLSTLWPDHPTGQALRKAVEARLAKIVNFFGHRWKLTATEIIDEALNIAQWPATKTQPIKHGSWCQQHPQTTAIFRALPPPVYLHITDTKNFEQLAGLQMASDSDVAWLELLLLCATFWMNEELLLAVALQWKKSRNYPKPIFYENVKDLISRISSKTAMVMADVLVEKDSNATSIVHYMSMFPTPWPPQLSLGTVPAFVHEFTHKTLDRGTMGAAVRHWHPAALAAFLSTIAGKPVPNNLTESIVQAERRLRVHRAFDP